MDLFIPRSRIKATKKLVFKTLRESRPKCNGEITYTWIRDFGNIEKLSFPANAFQNFYWLQKNFREKIFECKMLKNLMLGNTSRSILYSKWVL